ncbi:MAG: hypothetical protein KAR11_03125 [Phycisphaerae bacterium]|nr:hypothetical protein [Phycisphaerae bacterium]
MQEQAAAHLRHVPGFAWPPWVSLVWRGDLQDFRFARGRWCEPSRFIADCARVASPPAAETFLAFCDLLRAEIFRGPRRIARAEFRGIRFVPAKFSGEANFVAGDSSRPTGQACQVSVATEDTWPAGVLLEGKSPRTRKKLLFLRRAKKNYANV